MSGHFAFGCMGNVPGIPSAGHHLYEPGYDRVSVKRYPGDFPPAELDTGYCHKGPPHQPQGGAKLTHPMQARGWTVLAVWDRTGDSRPGSHTTFLVHAVCDFVDACAEAKLAFPELWARIVKAGPVYLLPPEVS